MDRSDERDEELARLAREAALARLARVSARLRAGERLSHTSAATWCDLPLPTRIDQRAHVTGPLDATQVRRRDVVGHRDDVLAAESVRGVAVSTPERMFVELASVLDLDSLIAVGDHLVHAPRSTEPGRPFTTLAALRDATEVGSRRKAVPLARSALDLVRHGVESPMETALRLLLVRAGIPEPVCGYRLMSPERRFIGWFDLAWPEHGDLGEYDGDQHRRSRAQYELDIRRYDLAADAGWRTIRVRAAGMTRAGRAETVARFARHLTSQPSPRIVQLPPESGHSAA